jgi:hypothetical protein
MRTYFRGIWETVPNRVSFETSFDLKQPKLELKLVSALSETKHSFRLFRFYTETETFDVLIELKQTEDQPKQFDREQILLFFTENLGVFRLFRFFLFFFVFLVFSVCFGSLQNSSICFGCFDIGSKHRNKPKLFAFLFHKTNRNKRKTDLFSVCFGSNRNLFLFVSRTP